MTKEIKLTCGKVAIVDDCDFEYLSQWKWFFDGRYATRTSNNGTTRGSVRMHAQLMNTPPGMVTDHINRNKLDNRRSNLRICTQQQNCHNIPMLKNNTTGERNVYYKKQTGKFFTQLMFFGKLYHLGYFDTKEAAAKARDIWLSQH